MARAAADDPLDGCLEGLRSGDPDALGAVYLAVAPGLRGYLRRRVPHGEVADDLVEQTFLELLGDPGAVRGGGRALRAWLYRAARNNLVDWARAAERRSQVGLPDDVADRLADPGADVESAALADSVDPELVAALARLTPAQREVLELRVVAGLSLAAVADLTGRSVGAVKLLQHRALRRLAELLAVRRSHGA